MALPEIAVVASLAVVLSGCGGGPSEQDKLERYVESRWERPTLEGCNRFAPTSVIDATGRESAFVCEVRGLAATERDQLYMVSGYGLAEEREQRLRQGDELFYVPETTSVRVCFIVINFDDSLSDVGVVGAVPKAGGRCLGVSVASDA